MNADSALDRVFRAEAGRLTASLVGIVRDWDLAEELVQDAMVVALEVWPRTGLPDNPAAWLLTTARRRAIDRLRRDAVGRTKAAEAARALDDAEPAVRATDDRLRLIFACCHPALRPESQVALTLRAVAGLAPAEIARALLVTEPTIAKRLVRAKKKIAQAGIPYRLPPPQELPERLERVLAVIYLIFNEGYLASRGVDPQRHDLAEEAEWLASTLHELLPEDSEIASLLALIRFHMARTAARFDGDDLVLLEDQDRSRWNPDLVRSAADLLEQSASRARRGPYELQARIAACHASASSFELTPWHEIAALYDELYARWTTPVVALNRGIAIAYARGWEAGLDAIEPLAGALDEYAPFHSTRSELLRRSGQNQDAIAAATRAVALTTNPAERRLLHKRIGQMAGTSSADERS
jgi:RNA polymerase sigma-70 factor (ECF subfamily)